MAEGNVQLKLQATLDLAYLRGQLAGLKTIAQQYDLTIVANLDGSQVKKELTNLSKQVKININDSQIDGARSRLGFLNKSLATLRRTTSTPIEIKIKYTEVNKPPSAATEQIGRAVSGGVRGGQALEGFDKGQLQATRQMMRLAKMPVGPLGGKRSEEAYLQSIVEGFKNASQESIDGLANGLKNGKSRIAKAAQEVGEESIRSIKNVLGIASPSREFEKIGEDAGKGFEIGIVNSLIKAENVATARMQKMLDRLARMALMAAGFSPEQIANDIASQKQKNISQASIIPLSPLGPSKDRSFSRLLPPGSSAPKFDFSQFKNTEEPGGKLFPQERTLKALQERLQKILTVETVTVTEDVAKDFKRAAYGFSMVLNAIQEATSEAEKATKRLQLEEKVNRLVNSLEKQIDAANARSRGLGQKALAPSKIAGLLPAGPSQSSILELNIILAGAIRAYFKAIAAEISNGPKAKISQTPLLPGNTIAGLLGPSVGRMPSRYDIKETQDQFFARRTAEAYGRSAVRGLNVASERKPALPGTTFMGDAFVRGGGADRVRGFGREQKGGAIVPYGHFGGPSTLLPKNYYENVRKYNAALDVATASAKNFSNGQIPLIGGLREIASEFGQAAKQVILYGTAYRGLAFITSLPGQILNAAKSQQQFSNGFKVATQDTGTFAKELLYVNNVQRAFGLDLETTRTGFTKLYASMAPTGFDSGSIEKLFTGISAATAALQLTPDKAERVIYAFGQMASKGQVMSEELKGQLGDVLPGALAIFAKAAGMSVQEFSKAMEDGEFVGNRFREVFAKVSDELINRFGTGAQAAGRSLQGLINTVGGDFKRVLESFSPLADSAAQAILGPLGGSLKQLSMSAQIATGEIERVFMQLKESQQDLQNLRTSTGADGIVTDEEARQIQAAEQNVAALTVRYKELQRAASDPAIAKQAQDITAFTEELAKAGTFVMNVAKTIGSILSPALNFLGTNLTTVIGLITSFYIGLQTARLTAMALMSVLLLYRTLSAILGFGPATLSANALAAAFNGLGVAATGATVKTAGLRLAMTALVASTVVGAVVAGIIAIASAFATMRDRAKEARQSSQDALENAAKAASMGSVIEANTALNNELAKNRAVSKSLATLEKIYAKEKDRMKLGSRPIISTEDMAALRRGAEYSNEIAGILAGNQQVKGGFQIQSFMGPELGRARKEAGQISAEAAKNIKLLKADQKSALQTAKEIGLDKPSATKPAQTGLEETEQEKQKRLRDEENARQLAEVKRKYEADSLKLSSEQAMKVDDITFEHWKTLQEQKYDLLGAGENEWQSKAIRFQRDLQAIEIRRIEAIRRAQQETENQKVEANAAAIISKEPQPFITGRTGLFQGSTGASSGPHFDVRRQDGAPIREGQARALFDKSVSNLLTMTSPYGPRRAPVPGSSSFHGGVDLAGPANTPLNLAQGYTLTGVSRKGGLGNAASVRGPQGEMYDVGHLQAPGAAFAASQAPPSSRASQVDLPASRQRKQLGNNLKENLQVQQTLNTADRESILIKYGQVKAIGEVNILIKQYVASIFPVEQQKLENSLLQDRINLMSSGVFGKELDLQIEMNRKRGEGNILIEEAKNKITEINEELKANKITQEEANREIAKQQLAIEGASAAMEKHIPLLRKSAELQAQISFTEITGPMGQLQRQGQVLAAPLGQERFVELQQQNPSLSKEQITQQVQLEETIAKMGRLREAVKGVGDGINNSIGTALVDSILKFNSLNEVAANFLNSVAGYFRDLANTIIQEMTRALVNKAVSSLLGSLFSAPSGAIAGGFGDAAFGGNFNPGTALAFSGPNFGFANGGIAQGGFRAFATGGIVQGPTLGLVGEGRYNEAVVPLPDGKSIPVDLQSNGSNQIVSNITINVSNGQTKSDANNAIFSDFGRKIEGAVKQVIVGELRPGGLLSR